MILYIGNVFRRDRMGKICFEVRQRLGKQAGLHVKQAPVAHFGRDPWIEHQDPVYRRKRLLILVFLRINAFEVIQHPGDD